MKKLMILIATCLTASLINLSGQSVPNGGFENWSNVSFENSSDWFTSAGECYRNFGVNNATKVTDKISGNFAIKLETKINSTDTAFAYFANGDPGNPVGQGIPVNQPLTHIKGYFKNAQVGTDFGVLWLIFKKAGTIIQDTFYIFPGVNPNYTPFMLDLKLGGQVPDSVIVAGASSDPFTGNIKNGSWIQFDSLTFDNSGTKISIPGGNFENWVITNFEEPNSWTTNNSDLVPNGGTPQAEKTTDKFSGIYALKLTTKSTDWIISTITNGIFTNNGMKGGQPYPGGLTDTVIGYYKYFPQGSDSGNIFLQFSKNGIQGNSYGKGLSATNTYTYFEFPFSLSLPADTLRIDIKSSNWPYNQSDVGSTLYLDGLMLKSDLAISVKEHSRPFANPLYPNPAAEYITADIVLKESSEVTIRIFDVTGKVVYSNQHKGLPSGKNEFKVNTSSFKPGIYICELKAGEQAQTSRFKVE